MMNEIPVCVFAYRAVDCYRFLFLSRVMFKLPTIELEPQIICLNLVVKLQP